MPPVAEEQRVALKALLSATVVTCPSVEVLKQALGSDGAHPALCDAADSALSHIELLRILGSLLDRDALANTVRAAMQELGLMKIPTPTSAPQLHTPQPQSQPQKSILVHHSPSTSSNTKAAGQPASSSQATRTVRIETAETTVSADKAVSPLPNSNASNLKTPPSAIPSKQSSPSVSPSPWSARSDSSQFATLHVPGLSDFDPSAYHIAQPVYAFTTARSSSASSAAGTARLSQPQLPDTSLILTAASKRMFLASIHGPCGSFDSGFSGPHGVLIDSVRQRLLVADRLAHRVLALDRNSLDKVWQHGVTGEGGSGFENLFYPHAIALSASQTMLYVADCRNHRIVTLMADDGSFVSAFGSKGHGTNQFHNPTGVCATAENQVWVADSGNNRVLCFHARGAWTQLRQLNVAEIDVPLSNPLGVSMDSSGTHVLVCDTGNNRVHIFNALSGLRVASISRGDSFELSEPISACTSADLIFVSEWGAARVSVFRAAAPFEFVGALGGLRGNEEQSLEGVRCICFDDRQQHLLVADSKLHKIAEFRNLFS